MNIDKELWEDLERCAKEVEAWPEWKRSVDLRDLKKMTEVDKCAME